MNRPAERKYDVAISFLHGDEPLARRLHGSLTADGLSVFVYSKVQEEIVGNDGLEEFRQAFRGDCRLIVVLYRDGWGQTPWTRIEQTAIQERCLADGWDVLLFVTLDERCTVPRWLPDTRIRLSMNNYAYDQLVGAIKVRVEEQGGSFKKMDALGRARLEQERADFQKTRREYLDSMQGVQALRAEVVQIFAEIDRLRHLVMAETAWRFDCEAVGHECVLRNDRVSTRISFSLQHANRAEDGKLDIQTFSGQLLFPGQQGHYPWGHPKVLTRDRFVPDVVEGMVWRWKSNGHQRVMTSHELADHCVQQFVTLMRRAAGGELPGPDL